MKTFRDLQVWQKGMDMSVSVYEVTSNFPKKEEYGLISQLRRCAVSIPSNIAEGFGRNHTKDFIRFLRIAQGSVYECQTQLEISFRVGFIQELVFKELDHEYETIAKMLSSFIRKLSNSENNR